jgi:hypothetical protein
MKRLRLIDGPVLLGFAELFDRSFGDPTTPRPYATIAPATVGKVLLPFPCPRCTSVQGVCPPDRAAYSDPNRGFSFCSSCGLRYVLDEKGAPLETPIEPGAKSAPPTITKAGKTLQLPPPDDDALALIGARP